MPLEAGVCSGSLAGGSPGEHGLRTETVLVGALSLTIICLWTVPLPFGASISSSVKWK